MINPSTGPVRRARIATSSTLKCCNRRWERCAPVAALLCVLCLARAAAAQTLTCPAGSLYSHPPVQPPAVNLVSEASVGQLRSDFYQDAPGPIDGVIFWGTERQFASGFPACVESNPTFTIRFMQDDGGAPGAVVCSHTLVATRTPTGVVFSGATINEYQVALPAPCSLATGWISIVGEGDAGCHFFWLTSAAGDGTAYCQGCVQPVTTSGDLSLCLLGQPGGILGACCDEFIGLCTDDVDVVDCIQPHQRFEQGVACFEMQEPCAAVAGACCRSDNTCDVVSESQCDAVGGNWLGLSTGCNACPLSPVCPPGSLHAQLPANGENFSGNTSESSATIQRSDNFTHVAGTITALRFWGFDLDRVGNAWVECEEFDNTFSITFYSDYGGVPDAPVCSETVTATRTPTGLLFGNEDGPAELNQYDATLTTPCVLTNGWVSIVGLGDQECWFLWMNSFEGDLISHCTGCQVPEGPDLAVCMMGTPAGVTGACCTDDTGVCTPDVAIELCAEPTQRFAPNADCSAFDPPCGEPNGACCFGSSACNIRTQATCAALEGEWLGPLTHCSACPCEQPCPDGGTPEIEPVCGPGFGEGSNGGCNATTPAFEPLPLNQTICGTVGFTEAPGGVVYDEDWFLISAPQFSVQEWQIDTEFPAQVAIYDVQFGCEGLPIAEVLTAPCSPPQLTTIALEEDQQFWLVIRPILVDEVIACGARYTARAALLVDCQPGDLIVDGNVNGLDIQPFVSCMLEGSAPGVDCLCAEIDGLSGITLEDADALVNLLLSGD